MKPDDTEAPRTVDYSSVEGLTDLREIAEEYKKAELEIQGRREYQAGLRARAHMLLFLAQAPKSVAAEGVRFTQTEPKKARETFVRDAFLREADTRGLELGLIKEALAASMKKGKPGEAGLTITVLKEGEPEIQEEGIE